MDIDKSGFEQWREARGKPGAQTLKACMNKLTGEKMWAVVSREAYRLQLNVKDGSAKDAKVWVTDRGMNIIMASPENEPSGRKLRLSQALKCYRDFLTDVCPWLDLVGNVSQLGGGRDGLRQGGPAASSSRVGAASESDSDDILLSELVSVHGMETVVHTNANETLEASQSVAPSISSRAAPPDAPSCSRGAASASSTCVFPGSAGPSASNMQAAAEAAVAPISKASECLICQDDKAHGLFCKEVQAHFVCVACLPSYVRHIAEKDVKLRSVHKGNIPCPDPQCKNVWTTFDISRYLSEDTFSIHERSRKDCIEYEALLTQQKKNAEQGVEAALRHIHDLMTPQCPRCHAAFVDFGGCWALSCHRCPCKFCGYCLKDVVMTREDPTITFRSVGICSAMKASSNRTIGNEAGDKYKRMSMSCDKRGTKQT